MIYALWDTRFGAEYYISQYKIENVVASAFLGTELNLQDLAISLDGEHL